ncbi:serine protease [Planococcus sp. 11815]|uniref:S1 family peptidase n=1 Tax=Planococcus sp. 11815 TaxID=2939413 RepID=UPI003DA56AC0
MNYSTARIVSKNDDGVIISTGTGFIIRFAEHTINEKKLFVPAIVTNKHVIKDAEEIVIRFHLSNLNGERINNPCEFIVPTNEFFMHPDSEVDLCAMPLADLYIQAEKDRIKPYYYGISLEQIPTSEKLRNFLPTDDVVVVGYPDGLWDEMNNLPIFRKGILATTPAINYGGEKEFLIDCAIYPGSSGSPVFSVKHLFNKKTYEPILSIELLGVVYATYQHTVQGELVIKDIPTSTNTFIPNHLGVVLNSTRIHEMNEIISEFYRDMTDEHIHNAIYEKSDN